MRQALDESKDVPAFGSLSEALREVEAYGADTFLHVDVAHAPRSGEDCPIKEFRHIDGTRAQSKNGASSSNGALDWRPRVFPWNQPPARKAGQVRAGVLYVLAADLNASDSGRASSPEAADALEMIMRLGRDRPCVIVAAPQADTLTTWMQREAWFVDVCEEAHPDKRALAEYLSGRIRGALPDVLRAYGMASGVLSIASAYGEALRQESRGLAVKKTLTQQRVGRLSRGNGNVRANEILTNLRKQIGDQFADFERGADVNAQSNREEEDGFRAQGQTVVTGMSARHFVPVSRLISAKP